MPNPMEVYRSLNVFLASVDDAFERSLADGDYPSILQMRYWLESVMNSPRASTPSPCADENMRRLLGYMKNIPGWTKQHHESALAAGGYASDFVPWPKTSADP